jgi:3-methyladenine DNA glycosylase AlkC
MELGGTLQEELEDTKEVIGIRKSMKDRRNKDQRKKVKRSNNDLQSTMQKQKMKLDEPHSKTAVNSGAPEG